jgi:hypothetical protein
MLNNDVKSNQREYLQKLYQNRFDLKQQKAKLKLWKILGGQMFIKASKP